MWEFCVLQPWTKEVSLFLFSQNMSKYLLDDKYKPQSKDLQADVPWQV